MVVPTLRVLLAENGFTEAGLTLRSLCAETGWSLELMFVSTRSELAHALLSYCPDVAFIQLALLQPDAPARLRVLHQSHPSIPFILLAPHADIACAVSCLSVGANDFMLEGFMDERTMARVLGAILGLQRLEVLETLPPSPNTAREMHPLLNLSTQPAPFPKQRPHHDYALSVAIENPEHLNLLLGDAAVERISQELAQLLRTCVRPKDLLVPVSRGKCIVYFSGIREAVGPAILHRIKSLMRPYRPSLHPSLQLTLVIAAENCLLDAKPALRHASSDEPALLCSPDTLTEVS